MNSLETNAINNEQSRDTCNIGPKAQK